MLRDTRVKNHVDVAVNTVGDVCGRVEPVVGRINPREVGKRGVPEANDLDRTADRGPHSASEYSLGTAALS